MHYTLGTVASYGILKGAANIHGIQLKDTWAWLAHRGYHLLAMPTHGPQDPHPRRLGRRMRSARIDLTPTDDLEDPRHDFRVEAEKAGAPR